LPLLTLGALAVVIAVAWSVTSRTQAAPTVASDHPAPQTVVATAEATPSVEAAAPITAAQPAAPAPAEAALKAYIDPETGELSSAPVRSGAVPLGVQPTARPERLPEITLEDGSVMVHLQGHFEESTVLTIDENGRRVMTCTQHPGEIHAHDPAPVQTREVQ
jgi:hypothetical protein